jgi:outer membrane protein OmpA-like peptidoglycan-associated protein
MRARAVLSAALAMAAVAWAETGRAQVPDRYGFFGHIDGRWMWLGGDQIKTWQGAPAPSTNGPGGQMLLGFKMSAYWDMALAGDIQSLINEVTKFRNGTLSVDTRHQHVDLEFGYSENWWRVNFGLRGIHYNQGARYNVPGFAGYDQREMYGIGPKVGAGTRLGLSDNWAVIGGADAALVYTSFSDTGSGVLVNSGAYWGFVPQLGAELGVNWRSREMDLFSIPLGGRIATSFNTAITADLSRRGTLVEYGPFLRIAYNFAQPPHATTAAVARDQYPYAPAPGTSVRKLHFIYGRGDLAPTAAALVRQAADDARRGRAVELEIAGHDGRGHDGGSGAEDALALHRAHTVRDELLRYGLAPDQVVLTSGLRERKPGQIQILF